MNVFKLIRVSVLSLVTLTGLASGVLRRRKRRTRGFG
jgi:hypothetical protein